ncbi:SET domain-containing protein 5 [Madurella fahalii]|uniref:SET domain-containing protein 5 n=1 Tax=Madurella fahalii TaxID=1157608 RepID=A0ABQ0GI97_9PEZI
MFLLIFFALWQTQAVSCLEYKRDWTVCSRSTRDEPLFSRQEQGACPLATDWSPWSRKPFCIEPVAEDEPSPADCVFISHTFRGQGIALITTPDLATSLVDYLDDYNVSQRHGRDLTTSENLREDAKSTYEVRDLPGRGKGLVAKGEFAKHEIIMIGFPVFVVRMDFLNADSYTQRQKRLMMETGINQLPPEQKKAIMALAKSTGGEPILDVIRTNGFGIEIEGVQHLALFIDGSRVNHNCRPNAFWRYVNSNMAMEVVALRDIPAGEEIAHSYAPLGYTFEERKAVLQAWGFRCRCALCSAAPAERHLSDSRRERLLELHRTLGQASGLSNQRVDELVLEATMIIQQENLEPQLVEYYQQFARAYMMTNNLKRAREMVTLADQLWLLYGGEEHENVEGLRELWNALEEMERDAEDE